SVVGNVDDVGGNGQTESYPQAGALDGSESWCREFGHLAQYRGNDLAQVIVSDVIGWILVGDVSSGAESAAFTAEQQGANAGFCGIGVGLAEFGDSLLVQGVHFFRRVERDFGNIIGDIECNHVIPKRRSQRSRFRKSVWSGRSARNRP